MMKGGRLFYVGAGTSGRIGVLDAVECTPTFGVDRKKLVGIIAGGEKAMFVAQENIEDDYELGINEAAEKGISQRDSVIGITASGETPFVLGFIEKARKTGAFTVGLCCNNGSSLEEVTEKTIKPIVGPEVITGSTRMKAGTAQKLVLNMISTTVMIKMNKVYSNLMVDLRVTNRKLEQRAKEILSIITGEDLERAEEHLIKADYNVKHAIVMSRLKCSLEEAADILKRNKGNLRDVLESF